MSNLDELFEKLEVLRNDTEMDRDERSKRMRRVRKQIRKLGGSIRPRKGTSSGTSKRSRRRKTNPYLLRSYTTDALEAFAGELTKAATDSGKLEVLPPDTKASGQYHGWSSTHLLSYLQNENLTAEALLVEMAKKFFHRWKVDPQNFRIIHQGEMPLFLLGPVPVPLHDRTHPGKNVK